MKGLIFMPTTNSEGKRDTTGAFQPEALKFAREHNIHPDAVVRFDNSAGKPWRRAEVLDALKRRAGLSCVAFFCHGWANGIQAGFDIATVAQLAGAPCRCRHRRHARPVVLLFDRSRRGQAATAGSLTGCVTPWHPFALA
jgi:hypothetical protein